jgi:hypothetical protein
MYTFVNNGQGWWLMIPPIKNGYNPILDEVKINHLNNQPHNLNIEGKTIYVNDMGGWHTGNGTEMFSNMYQAETLTFSRHGTKNN